MSNIIYYNVSISNAATNTAPISVNLSSSSQNYILQNPQEYYGSIIRCNINQFLIPISYFKVQEPVNDVNLGIYSFTLSYNNSFSEQTYLEWVPSNNATPIPPVGTPKQTKSNYYFIYSYQKFVDCMNVALKAAYANLQSVVGGGTLPDDKYPYVMYNNNNQQLEIHAPETLYDSNNGNNFITIYFNTPMHQYLHGFEMNTLTYNSNNGCNYNVVVKSLPDANIHSNVDTNGYLVMHQEACCLSYWNMLRNVVITSSLNIQGETVSINAEQTESQNIITDYIPDLSGADEALIGSKQFIYNASSLYRLFEFNSSNTPLQAVTCQIYYTDNDGNLWDLKLFPGMRCDIKFMFIKKSIYLSLIHI